MSYLKYDGTVAVETGGAVSSIYGSSGVAGALTGGSANDAFFGNGPNTMTGGAGDDTYYFQAAGDKVVELAGGGADMIVAWQSNSLAKFANVENLKIDGDGLYAAGNALNNIIIGGSGVEQIYGGLGQDVLVGGSGQDTFIVQKGQGNDAIYGFKTAGDVVRLTAGYTNFAQVQQHMTQVGSDVKIDMGGGDGVVLRGVQASQLSASNFQLQLDKAKLGAMTFHDEFSSPVSIWNPTYNPNGVWRPDYGYQGSQGVGSYTLVGNGEKEIYTSPYFRDHPGNFSESPFVSNSDGTLSIVAKPSSNPELFGYGYTSGMISTKQSFAQTYGYFEMRADLPEAAGGWPAFWLVPADGSWPPELDVMETLTNDSNADWTSWHSQATGTHTGKGIPSYIPDTADGFHTYGVLWTKTDLAWYVDGVEVFHQPTPADMNKPMYMIANLALGGWGGDINNAQMPAEMKIDYIRAYNLGSGPDTGIPVSSTTPVTGGSTPPPTPTPTPTPTPDPTPAPGTGTAGQTIVSHAFHDTLVGTAGNDTLVSTPGGETMTGGAGADTFSFKTMPWTPVHVTDFTSGVDKLDISALYAGGYKGTNPVADGYVVLQSDGAGGTQVLVDADGRGTAQKWPTYVADLEHVDPSKVTAAVLFGGSAPSSGGTTPAPTPTPIPPAASGVVLTSAKAGDVLTGGAGADTLNASQGTDTLTGGAGADHFVFGKLPWAPAHITDFTHGQDVIDLRGLFAGTGYTGNNPLADHYLSMMDDGNGGTKLIFDVDGPGPSPQWGSYFVDIEHVAPSTFTNSDWIIR